MTQPMFSAWIAWMLFCLILSLILLCFVSSSVFLAGILSLFCAQAGASKVYAVEASNLAHVIRKVVDRNQLSHVIEVSCVTYFVLLPSMN